MNTPHTSLPLVSLFLVTTTTTWCCSSLLLVVLCFSGTTTATTTTMDPSELQTLFTIMETLSSDQPWRLSYPNPCRPGAAWIGIECKPAVSDAHLHVTRLDFGAPPNPTCKNTSSFPPQLFRLPYLQSLFISHCFTAANTTIQLPQRHLLPHPPPLQQLSLRSNPALLGPIPPLLFTHLASSLQILTLSQNRLSGAIPGEISELNSLLHLDLSYNLLAGEIPGKLFTLRNLVGLDLSYNSISGPIPDTIGRMGDALQKLDLSSNSLTGAVPAGIGNLTAINFIALSNNRLSGGFSGSLSKLKNLQYFIMDHNPMFVPLPVEFSRLPRLQELRLADSGYSGEIPAAFSLLSNLSTLSLENNRLTGRIPAGFGNLSRIYHINLSGNWLSGVVPFSSSFVKRLGKNLDLGGNPGLCLDPDQEYEIDGVGFCGSVRNSTTTTSIIKPLKGRTHSQASPLMSSNLRLSLFFCVYCMVWLFLNFSH